MEAKSELSIKVQIASYLRKVWNREGKGRNSVGADISQASRAGRLQSGQRGAFQRGGGTIKKCRILEGRGEWVRMFTILYYL